MGTLLFWAPVLSVFGSLALVLTPRRPHELLPTVAGVVALVASFFISVMLFGHANPFHRLPYTPLDGSGLNPQLQNPGMVFHPPMLYLGYIDRKSTRLNSSHSQISYAVFCLKKKQKIHHMTMQY